MRWGTPVLLGVLALAGVASADWSAVAPGIRTQVLLDGGGHAFELDLKQVRLEIVEARAQRRRTAGVKELAAGLGSHLAVNGGFFDEKSSPLGLLVSDGKRLSALRRADWGVLYINADHAARLVHTRDFDTQGAPEFAIQAGPRLVVDGKPLTLKPQWDRRTAIGLRDDGHTLIIVVTRVAVSLSDLAALMSDTLGCRFALNLDGGSSTQLWTDFDGVPAIGGFSVANAVVVLPRAPAAAPEQP